MKTPRRRWRRGDGSATVRGWVAIYTLGLPRATRMRRRYEVAADLADERLDAVRRGSQGSLFRQRLIRLVRGIVDDLSWRVIDAPRMALDHDVATRWVPLDRWSLALSSIVAIGSGGALAIVAVPAITGQTQPDPWVGWGPVGFTIGAVAALVGILVSVPWPRRGALIVLPGVLVGLVAAPLLWGCWFLAVVAVAVRWYEVESTAEPGPIDLVVRTRKP